MNFDESKRNKITYICLRKCINDFHKQDISPGEKICLNRCAFKFIDTLHYGNRVMNLIEDKINAENELKQNLAEKKLNKF